MYQAIHPIAECFRKVISITKFRITTLNFLKILVIGECKEAIQWNRISTNSHLVEIASKYLKKCGKVYIDGSLHTRKWKDRSGNKKEITEIRADVLQLL